MEQRKIVKIIGWILILFSIADFVYASLNHSIRFFSLETDAYFRFVELWYRSDVRAAYGFAFSFVYMFTHSIAVSKGFFVGLWLLLSCRIKSNKCLLILFPLSLLTADIGAWLVAGWMSEVDVMITSLTARV